MAKKVITVKDVQKHSHEHGISYKEAKKELFAPKKSFQKDIEDKLEKK